MNIAPALLGISLYILIWEKLPEWGTWFNAGLGRLPAPLRTLYQQWRCPYCVGFWMGLALHAATGQWTLAALGELPSYWGIAAPTLGWILDALATATLIYVGKIAVDALGLPAMKAFMMKDKFARSFDRDTNP